MVQQLLITSYFFDTVCVLITSVPDSRALDSHERVILRLRPWKTLRAKIHGDVLPGQKICYQALRRSDELHERLLLL
jgi:hypothetical protein